jgi:hypothetical protein
MRAAMGPRLNSRGEGFGRLAPRRAPAIAEGWKPTAKKAKPAQAGSPLLSTERNGCHAFRVEQPCNSLATKPEARL